MARLPHEGRGLYALQPARTLIWFALFLALSVTLITLDQVRKLDSAENIAVRLLGPLQTAITQHTNPLFDFWSTLTDISNLRQENADLKQQVQQLGLENEQLQRARAENETMRAQLNYSQLSPQFQLLSGAVVGKDLHGLNDYIEIDRGRLDNVQRGMTVVSPDGFLVGRISQVTDGRSRVLIITNPSSSVAAMVMGGQQLPEDVVDGKLHGRLVMSSLPQDATLSAGSDVVTSGLGGTFPRGIKVGQVAHVSKSDVQLFQGADVAPYCDFGKLAAVEVITNHLPRE